MDLSFYREYFDLQTAELHRVDHEDALVAIVYKVTEPNGDASIIKICERKNDYYRELHFLNLFAKIISVPKVLGSAPPGEGTHGAIWMQYLPGRLVTSSDNTESLCYELGRTLATIHNERVSGYGDPLVGNLEKSPHIYFTFKFEEGLDECKNHFPSKLLKACHEYHIAHLDLLSDVDGPCIVHRDFRPGNIIVKDGSLQGVIDWAGARYSFAEEDFCSLMHPNWLASSRDAFTKGYQLIRSVPNYEPLIPLLRLNKAIATIGFTVKRGTWKTKDSRIYQYNMHFLEELLCQQ